MFAFEPSTQPRVSVTLPHHDDGIVESIFGGLPMGFGESGELSGGDKAHIIYETVHVADRKAPDTAGMHEAVGFDFSAFYVPDLSADDYMPEFGMRRLQGHYNFVERIGWYQFID